MIYISHRGNISGKDIDKENTIDYINNAIDLGYDVEIDIWFKEQFYLGHDRPSNLAPLTWLENKKDYLWIHCKNIESIEQLWSMVNYNYFWHETDTVTLTSKGFIWAYPRTQSINKSIVVLPEMYSTNITNCFGICSDNIKQYRDKL
jgi:hypothetical protein